MLQIILKRIAIAIPVILLVASLTFFLVRMAPGGPFDSEKVVSPQVLKNLNAVYNLDAPLVIQYKDYMFNLFQGDFGPSFSYPGRSVAEMISTGLPVTLELALYAMLIAMIIGGFSGVIAAVNRNTVFDYIPMTIAMIGICMPTFLLGPLLVLIFGINLELLPVAGWDSLPGDRYCPLLLLEQHTLPILPVLLEGACLKHWAKTISEQLEQKGLPEYQVILRHALQGGLVPVVSFLGPAIAGLIGGSFVVETIFQIPGLGRFYVEAAFNRDYTMILGTTIFFSTLIIFFNLLSDIAVLIMNPRARSEA